MFCRKSVMIRHLVSIPAILLINRHAILSTQPPEFILKRLGLVVLFLFANVRGQPGNMRWADRKGTVASLPLELAAFSRLVFGPF